MPMVEVIQKVGGRKVKTLMTECLVVDRQAHQYLCMWVDEPLRLKCGKCLRGVMSTRINGDNVICRVGVKAKCSVCGAKTFSPTVQGTKE